MTDSRPIRLTEQEPDHNALVQRAVRWLESSRSCEVVLREPMRHNSRQSPDAIGWRGTGWSIAIECKTSRSDYLAQWRKGWVRDGQPAMGQERWILTPKGLLACEELPEGWGLLQIHGQQVRRAHAPEWEWSAERYHVEAPMLVQAARGVQNHAVNERVLNRLRTRIRKLQENHRQQTANIRHGLDVMRSALYRIRRDHRIDTSAYVEAIEREREPGHG